MGKISSYTADAAPSSDDLIITVNDPSGTPANRKVTIENLFRSLPDGSVAAPSLAFANGLNMGIYKISLNELGLVSGGVAGFILDAGSAMAVIPTNYFLGWVQTRLQRDDNNILALKNDNNDQHYRIYGANGTYRDQGTISELLTIAAAASSTTTMSIPANAVVYAVTVRVTVVIPTAATFTVTGNTSGTEFDVAGGVAVAANTTDVGTALCPYRNGAAQTIRITPNVQPAADTGRVRVTIHYYFIQPHTS